MVPRMPLQHGASLGFASNSQHTPVPLTQSRNPSHNPTLTPFNREDTTIASNSQPACPSTTQPPATTRRPLPDPPTQTIIEDEDPQRSIEIPEDDEDDEAIGNGLGEEDGDPDDEDEGDDEVDEEVEVDDKGIAGKAKPSRRPLPHWLLEPFKARVAESSNQYRDAAGLPPLYAHHQTFWFPQPWTYFLIRKGLTPQQIFNPLFFLWDPAALCPDGIPCPNCRRVLHRHQAISRPCCQAQIMF